jgi:uncharacterized membrane protein
MIKARYAAPIWEARLRQAYHSEDRSEFRSALEALGREASAKGYTLDWVIDRLPEEIREKFRQVMEQRQTEPLPHAHQP